MIASPETKIKQIRELKNLTQEFVAESIGLTTRAYSKIENGQTQLTINRLNQISAILGVEPLEILEFDCEHVFNHFNNNSNNAVKNQVACDLKLSEKLIQQYEETIKSLKEQIELLKIINQCK
ncbi:helix-turn-helix domain-containing protein [Flavobacterium sp. UBA7680]|uniref:helix-turn-helix domain-containing protein n=1 Tax=Flavobacterium sp. UBA7680 TaxID=1946559 RepID=UPI0025BA6638|nr:helix-turn-helix domain-containing protein [Flavobacterium sp. UBA7680]